MKLYFGTCLILPILRIKNKKTKKKEKEKVKTVLLRGKKEERKKRKETPKKKAIRNKKKNTSILLPTHDVSQQVYFCFSNSSLRRVMEIERERRRRINQERSHKLPQSSPSQDHKERGGKGKTTTQPTRQIIKEITFFLGLFYAVIPILSILIFFFFPPSVIKNKAVRPSLPRIVFILPIILYTSFSFFVSFFF
eukprot:TRINITY_DN1495_c0_g1_i2.p1 TRINITY_DN1495_c0_g1~~TRINITY_DN1495_c0_g1_i2.p1  ORF type:complete len:194 (-),score=2.76 TRINITY_DN1495_c0_g1_i2:367-948(-)